MPGGTSKREGLEFSRRNLSSLQVSFFWPRTACMRERNNLYTKTGSEEAFCRGKKSRCVWRKNSLPCHVGFSDAELLYRSTGHCCCIPVSLSLRSTYRSRQTCLPVFAHVHARVCYVCLTKCVQTLWRMCFRAHAAPPTGGSGRRRLQDR